MAADGVKSITLRIKRLQIEPDCFICSVEQIKGEIYCLFEDAFRILVAVNVSCFKYNAGWHIKVSVLKNEARIDWDSNITGVFIINHFYRYEMEDYLYECLGHSD